MYLMDTNVWLERLLEQERSQEVGKFLDKITSNNLFINDFAFHPPEFYRVEPQEVRIVCYSKL